MISTVKPLHHWRNILLTCLKLNGFCLCKLQLNSLNSYLKSSYRSSKAHFKECLQYSSAYLYTKECTLSVYQQAQTECTERKTIRNIFFVFVSNALTQMEFHVSSVFLAVCHLVEIVFWTLCNFASKLSLCSILRHIYSMLVDKWFQFILKRK